jgi:type VI secretion system protein ImpK
MSASSPYPALARHSAAGGENLALLYQGVLTGIVRVKAGRQPIADAASFRKRMKDAFREIDREAQKLGYTSADVAHTNYAVVAFLDETVNRSADPNKAQWSALQSEMFERAVAGESFFDRLSLLNKHSDSDHLADILEVYYTCLLLGYQGQYAMDDRGELQTVMTDLRARIDSIRGESAEFSPGAAIPEQPEAPPPAPRKTGTRLRTAALAALVFVVLFWIAAKLVLVAQSSDVLTSIRRILVP